MGNSMFLIVLSLSLSGTLVGALLFALKPVIKNRFSKKWQYYIWLILIVRLLVPVTGEANLIGSFFRKAELKTENLLENVENAGKDREGNDIRKQTETPQDKETGGDSESNLYPENTDTSSAQENSLEINRDLKNSKNKDESLGEPVKQEKEPGIWNLEEVFEYVWLIWIFGALLMLSLKIADYRSFFRYIRAGNEEITDTRILTYMDDILMELKIKKNIGLYQNKLMISPMMAGFMKPFIVLPQSLPEDSEVRYILTHELMHYKRKDIWYKWLFQLASCIHWFNPFLLLVNKEINHSCELACDEAVLQRCDHQEQKEYGSMLLNLADQGIRYRNNVLSTTLLENKKNLKERLKNIMNYKKISKGMMFCSVMGICFISGFAIAAGAKNLPAAPVIVQNPKQEVTVQQPVSPSAKEETVISDGKYELNSIHTSGEDKLINRVIQNVKIDNRGARDTDDKLIKSKASKTYGDNKLIAGRDTARSFSMWGSTWDNDDGTMKMKKFKFEGAFTAWILYINKPVKMEVNYSVTVKEGKCKLVQIGPDNSVKTLFEGNKSGTVTTTLPEGRTAFKLVSEAGTMENVNISFGKIDTNSVLASFGSEGSEESARLLQEVIPNGTVQLDKLLANAKDMDSEDVSYCIVSVLKAGSTLTESQWGKLLEHSDEEILGPYVFSLIKAGKEVSLDIMKKVVPGMSEESVSEYVIYLLEHNSKITDKEFEKMVWYADETILSEYFSGLIKSGKVPNSNKIMILAQGLEEEDLTDYIIYMIEHNLVTDYAKLQELSYYADDDMLDAYILKQMKSGKEIDFKVFSSLEYSLSEDSISNYILNGLKNDTLTSEQIEKMIYNADEDIVGDGILKLAKSQKGFSFHKIKPLLYGLGEETIAEYIMIMIPKEKEKAIEFLLQNHDTMDEDLIGECVSYAIEKGVKITYDDMKSLEYCMDSDDFSTCITELVKNKMLTAKQAKELR